jgi:predicted nucleic acid-binding protein
MACAITDIFYVTRRLAGLQTAHTAASLCLQTFEICTVNHQALEQAQTLLGNDLEDNLQIACASLANLDAIITRDKKGFQASTIPVLTPAELLTLL